MDIQQVMEMTNDNGREWLRWHDKVILGIEERKEESDWFYVVYRYKSDSKVYVLSTPRKDSECKAGSMGHLYRYALLVAIEEAGIQVQWKVTTDWPIWPTWYCQDEVKLRKFNERLDEILAKYGFDRKTIEQNLYS